MLGARIAFIALGSVLAASGANAGLATGMPVELVAPRAGAVLAGGQEAELAWARAGDSWSTFGSRDIEEWEAFLSLDGGRSYPLRITPHLDLDIARVRWRVPNVATTGARLLLRFGNEREEIALELPQSFTIVARTSAGLDLGEAFAATVFERGEAPLPGRPGVIGWVEGARRGGGWRRVAAAEPFAFSAASTSSLAASEALPAAEPAPDDPPAVVRSAARAPAPAVRRPRPGGSGRRTRPFIPELLLQTGRRNE